MDSYDSHFCLSRDHSRAEINDLAWTESCIMLISRVLGSLDLRASLSFLALTTETFFCGTRRRRTLLTSSKATLRLSTVSLSPQRGRSSPRPVSLMTSLSGDPGAHFMTTNVRRRSELNASCRQTLSTASRSLRGSQG